MNMSVAVADWNPNGNNGRGEIRATVADSVRLNKILLTKVNKVDAELNEYNLKYPGKVNEDVIAAYLDDKPLSRRDKGKDFAAYVEKRLAIDYNLNKIGYSRYQNGKSSMNILRQFLMATGNGIYKDDSIYVGEISVELLDKYIKCRRNFKNNSDQTINHALTPILKACDTACTAEYIDREINA